MNLDTESQRAALRADEEEQKILELEEEKLQRIERLKLVVIKEEACNCVASIQSS